MTTLQPAASPLSTKLTLARTDESDVQQRQIYASIDGGRNHSLVYGDVLTVEITPGDHILKANNTLYWRTVRFTARAGEDVRFALVNRAGRFTLALLALLGVGPLNLVVERRLPS